MPFNRSALAIPAPPVKLSLIFNTLLFLFCLGIANPVAYLLQAYPVLTHTVLELICIFIALGTFFVVWYTFKYNSSITNLIGFGFLVIAILSSLHTLYFPLLNLSTANDYRDICFAFCLAAQFVESLIALLVTVHSIKIKSQPKKWLWLSIALGVTAIIYAALFLSNHFLPALYIPGQGSTAYKLTIETFILGLLIIALIRIRAQIHRRTQITYRYIFLALLFAIPSNLTHILSDNIASYYHALSHCLNIVSYMLLFKGIVASGICYPHAKLHETHQTVHAILNALPWGIITTDHNGELLFANRKANIILGNDVKYVLPQLKHHKIKKRRIEKIITATTSQGQNLKLRLDTRQLANGTNLYMFDEAKSEQTLEYIKLQTLTILDAIVNPIFIIDSNARIIMSNKAFAAAMGMDVKEVPGTKLSRLRNRFRIKTRRITTINGRFDGYQAEFTTSDGVHKEYIIIFAPITNVDNEIIGNISIATDITNITREYELLQQREKLAALGQMAAGIVHEIKNPLTTLKGFAQLIGNKTNDPLIKKYARIMEAEANDVNKVVSDFLLFAKPQPAVIQEVKVNELIQSLRVMLESNAFIKGIRTEFSLSPFELPVLADPSHIKQVIFNITENAMHAMENTPLPLLKISTRLSGNEMQIDITDNGVGIPPECINKIGLPFFTTKSKGTGLGLSICYQIVKEYNGRITINSQPGRGTTFTVGLPCSNTVCNGKKESRLA